MTACDHHHGQSPWHEAADRLSMTPPPPGERPLDGTATGRITTKEPPLTGKKVPAVLACIAEWFPQAFVPEKYLPHRPLKIGIHIDLKARCPALSERERSAVLRYYVARLMYLRACVAGAPRIDLDGKVCGEVTAAEAQHADARLAAILAARARKQELGQVARGSKACGAPQEGGNLLKKSPRRRDAMAWRRCVRRRRRGGRSHEPSPRRHRFRSDPGHAVPIDRRDHGHSG